MNDVLVFIVTIIGCEAVGIVSGLYTIEPIKTWYKKLNKPSFNPPNGIFGPVWTLLYALMAISFSLILISPEKTTLSIVLFSIQLILNFFWSIIFFSWKKLTAAFIEILLLLAAIIATIVAFWPISPVAGLLLIPYALWVSFATVLTYSILKLNK